MEDIYTFKLHRDEFEKILQGKKTVQLAINDSKKQKFEVGNQITFKLEEEESTEQKEGTSQQLTATIDNLMYFNSDKEAVEMLGKEQCGYKTSATFDKASDEFLSSLSYENVEKNGIVAIIFKLNG